MKTALAVTGLLLSGCGFALPLTHPGCHQADPNIRQTVMNQAVPNYTAGDSVIARDEFLRDAEYPLPKDRQRFGLTRIYVLRTVSWFAKPESSATAGVHNTHLIATDTTGTRMYAFDPDPDSSTSAAFNLETPTSKTWAIWVNSFNEGANSPTNRMYGCVT